VKGSARSIAVVSVALALATAMACSNDQVACAVDTDCAQGQICRDGYCGPPNSRTSSSSGDSGLASPDTGADPGTSSGTSGTSSGTTSSGTSCSDVLGICASPFDCCSGLSCTNGVCR
jgi:hypothetical protein